MSVVDAIIFFDGVCNLCNGAVQFVIKHDKTKYFKFASLQSDFAIKYLAKKGIHARKMESILLSENGKIYNKSTAALRIGGRLSGGWKLIKIFFVIPRFIRDFVYDFIAKHRYRWFGRRDTCMIPDEDLKSRFLE